MVHFASDVPLRTQRGEGRSLSRRDAVMFWRSEIAYAAREKERRQRWNGRRGSSNLRSDSVCSPLPSVFSAEAGRRDKSAPHGRVSPLILLRDPRGRGITRAAAARGSGGSIVAWGARRLCRRRTIARGRAKRAGWRWQVGGRRGWEPFEGSHNNWPRNLIVPLSITRHACPFALERVVAGRLQPGARREDARRFWG